jgi:D-serine deaminase-like pyridoxal phosphate-dependent protein
MHGIDELPTPALILDAPVVRRNIQKLAEYTSRIGLGVRPHTKTHKSRRVAALQLKAGSVGLTMAKVGEAETISAASDDLLLAYPPVDRIRAVRLARLAHDRTVRAAIDSTVALETVAEAARRAKVTIGLLVDLDVGLGRTGVQSPQQALTLACAIDVTAGVRLDGIMCYPGHIWQMAGEQAAALHAVDAKLEETIDCWSQAGLAAGIVSGGSTPTAYQSHCITHLTEIRPGTYVYNDMNTVHAGFCNFDDCAARIVCTVISDVVPGQVVIDAGSKTLTSDPCVPAPQSGHGYVVEYPQAKITQLSEEHGQLDTTACDRQPAVGERVTVIPNHICPCINLQDTVWWCEAGEPPRLLTIDARGKLS